MVQPAWSRLIQVWAGAAAWKSSRQSYKVECGGSGTRQGHQIGHAVEVAAPANRKGAGNTQVGDNPLAATQNKLSTSTTPHAQERHDFGLGP